MDNGWNLEKVRTALEACDAIYSLSYELKNCIRGCYTGCKTYEELGAYIQELGQQLIDAGYDTENEPEDVYDEDEEA